MRKCRTEEALVDRAQAEEEEEVEAVRTRWCRHCKVIQAIDAGIWDPPSLLSGEVPAMEVVVDRESVENSCMAGCRGSCCHSTITALSHRPTFAASCICTTSRETPAIRGRRGV